ncbi:MAG: HPF/RaiA family ribosome-associated protein [Dehalococcoidia bacterium]|nr:HPF/RaiA family ribosome-associated protein [Dehalococcoidia bacterium]
MAAVQDGNSGPVNAGGRPHIRNTIVPEAGGDMYRLTRKYPEMTACPDCRAVYHGGRWQWPATGAPAATGAKEAVCPACRRIRDGYPAGTLTISGAFLALHREDVMGVLRAEEQIETAEHALNRVMDIEEADGRMVVTTTDIHLPRRIAEAFYRAYEGELSVEYAEDEQNVQVSWRRDDPHPPETAERAPILPYEIIDNGVLESPEANAYLLERIERLRRFYPRITSCRVVLEAPQNHHRKGGPYQVNIHADVPGGVARVTRQQADDLHVAIAQAFDAAQRQLEDHARVQRGQVSPTVRPARGRVARLFPEESYGFLTAQDGHEVYFHRNSVLAGEFDLLQVGDEVKFTEEPGEKGPQASSLER